MHACDFQLAVHSTSFPKKRESIVPRKKNRIHIFEYIVITYYCIKMHQAALQQIHSMCSLCDSHFSLSFCISHHCVCLSFILSFFSLSGTKHMARTIFIPFQPFGSVKHRMSTTHIVHACTHIYKNTTTIFQTCYCSYQSALVFSLFGNLEFTIQKQKEVADDQLDKHMMLLFIRSDVLEREVRSVSTRDIYFNLNIIFVCVLLPFGMSHKTAKTSQAIAFIQNQIQTH